MSLSKLQTQANYDELLDKLVDEMITNHVRDFIRNYVKKEMGYGSLEFNGNLLF